MNDMDDPTAIFEEHKWWATTQPDMKPVAPDAVDDTATFDAVDFSPPRKSRISTSALAAIAIGAAMVLSGIAGYLSRNPNPVEHPTNVTTSVLPRPTATRTRTVRVPGPVVTRHLRATVTARSTRVIPGPTRTVTKTPSTFPGPPGDNNE